MLLLNILVISWFFFPGQLFLSKSICLYSLCMIVVSVILFLLLFLSSLMISDMQLHTDQLTAFSPVLGHLTVPNLWLLCCFNHHYTKWHLTVSLLGLKNKQHAFSPNVYRWSVNHQKKNPMEAVQRLVGPPVLH